MERFTPCDDPNTVQQYVAQCLSTLPENADTRVRFLIQAMQGVWYGMVAGFGDEFAECMAVELLREIPAMTERVEESRHRRGGRAHATE